MERVPDDAARVELARIQLAPVGRDVVELVDDALPARRVRGTEAADEVARRPHPVDETLRTRDHPDRDGHDEELLDADPEHQRGTRGRARCSTGVSGVRMLHSYAMRTASARLLTRSLR